LGDLFEDVEFSTSLSGVSSVVGVIESAFLLFGGESLRSVLKFLFVLLESSSLVGESGNNLSELSSVSGKFGLGLFSELGDLDHQVVEVDLSLDFGFNVFIEEGGEIDLELFEEADALGKGGTVKGGSDFDEGLDWVGWTEFGELDENFGGGVWGDGSEFWDDDLKSVKDEFGLFLSGEEVFGVLSSLHSGGSFLLIEHNKHVFTGFDVFLEVSLSGSERFDSLGGLLDLVGGMRNSGFVVGDLIGAFTHFDGVSIISGSLLVSKVVHHVSDHVSDVLHWASR
jgi:hypothetical protein